MASRAQEGTSEHKYSSELKTIETYYKGILRSQFATVRPKEMGGGQRTILSHIAIEPKFELFVAEEITKEAYEQALLDYANKPHLRSDGREVVEYYNQTDAVDGKRMYADQVIMTLENEPQIVESNFLDWDELKLDQAPEKYLHECFIAYTPGSNHGRICGPAILKRIRKVDEKGIEVFEGSQTEISREALLERQGCYQGVRGCTRRIYGFNLGIKNWVNCIFGLIATIALLLWLFRCLIFGDCGTSSNEPRIVERIVHDTIYVEKNSKVDTVTYVDETTNTTVKMLSLPNVQFEKGRAVLLRSSIPQLNELAAYLLENKELSAEIIGHTDSDGDAEKNRRLSQERAEAVRQYLIDNGVSGNRVKATGKGESEPVTDNSTAEGRAMNRRVEVKLSQDKTSKTVRTKKN
jgi:outer membrane protein OmpA-like peptidoglycan-associated protein